MHRMTCQNLKGEDAYRAEVQRWRDLGANATLGSIITFCAFKTL
jgi:hypothetical protein